jgi:hypothetical protein
LDENDGEKTVDLIREYTERRTRLMKILLKMTKGYEGEKSKLEAVAEFLRRHGPSVYESAKKYIRGESSESTRRGDAMARPIKDMFLEILEDWDRYWKDEIGFHDFLNDYIEIDDGTRTYIIKKRKRHPERF